MKKAKKIIGFSLLIIVILVAIVGVLYAKTSVFDFMKNPKKLFFTYMGEITEGLPEDTTDKLTEKMSEKSYTSTGKMSWDINIDGEQEIQEYLDILNKLSLQIETKVDNQNEKVTSNINIKDEEGNLIGLQYISEENVLSFKVAEIFEKYITIKNSNLKELADKLGMDSTSIPDTLEASDLFSDIELTDEQIKEMKDRYYKVLYDSIDESNFERVKETITVNGKEVKANAYVLTLTEKETRNVIVALLKELRDDDILVDAFIEAYNSIASVEELEMETITKYEVKLVINSLITSLKNGTSSSSDKLKITVYEYRGNTVKVKMSMADLSIILDKEIDKKDVNMSLSMLEGKEKILGINMKSVETDDGFETTISTDKNTTEFDIEIKITESKDGTYRKVELKYEFPEISMKLNLETNIEFGDVQIEKINSNDMIILNDLTEKELNELRELLLEKVNEYYEKNRERLDKIIEIFQ